LDKMKNKKYFLKRVSNYAIVGGLGSLLLTSFTGCEDKSQNQGQSDAFIQASQKQGAFVIVEKDPNRSGYKIADEFPAQKTTIVLRENGTERILTQEEIDKLVAQEAKKIDNGTSGLTNPEISNGGLSLGEALLASAAGAIIGSYIGNKLFNNQNYQSQRRTSYKSPQTYSRSVNSFNKAKSAASSKTTSSKKSGFFGGNKGTSSRSSFGG
jgi:hypothetical protein